MRFAAFCCIALYLLVAPGKISAATACPWVTQGTADTMLGGESSATVQVTPEPSEGVCSFTLEQGGSAYSLKVVVRRTPDVPCPAGSKQLRGIGNEAAICTRRPSHDEVVERIVSRVREKHFTVSISIRRQSAQPPEIGHYEDGLKQIAETVAGNLF